MSEAEEIAPEPGTLRLDWGEPACGDARGRLACRVYLSSDADDLKRNGVRQRLKRAGFARCDGCGYWIAKEAETDADRFADLMHGLGALRLRVEHRGRGAPVSRH